MSRFSSTLRRISPNRSCSGKVYDADFGIINQSVKTKGSVAKRGLVALAAAAQASGGTLTETYEEVLPGRIDTLKHKVTGKVSGEDAYNSFLDVGLQEVAETPTENPADNPNTTDSLESERSDMLVGQES